MKKATFGSVAILLITGCASTPPDPEVVEFLRHCIVASQAQKEAWAYSQDLLVAPVPEDPAEQERLSEAYANASAQEVMIGMKMAGAGCPAGFIGTAETLSADYSETGKTKPSWPSAHSPANEESPPATE